MIKRAVVVGVNQYEDEQITNLDWAIRDAHSIGNALEDCCEFDRVRTLTSDMSSVPLNNQTIENAIEDLSDGMGLRIYWSSTLLDMAFRIRSLGIYCCHPMFATKT